MSLRIDSPPVRNAVTGEVDTALRGEVIQIVLRDTTTPYPIMDNAEDPVTDSLLPVQSSDSLPTFRIDDSDLGSLIGLYLDWWQPSSGKRGPILFDKVMRDVALAALEAAQDIAAESVRTVNGVGPDFQGNVVIEGGSGGGGTATWQTLGGKPDVFPPSGHTHTRADLSDISTLARQVLAATTPQQFRALIEAGTGNGTSNLQLGTSATTAAPGSHTHSQYVDSSQAAAIADARIAASGGAGSGGGSVMAWIYRSGAYPSLPSSKPAGLLLIEARGPVAPSAVPSWVGNGADQVPLDYAYNGGLS